MFKRRSKRVALQGPLTESTLRGWLVQHLADRVDLPESAIDTSRTFEEYGLDSRAAIQVTGTLEKVVERRLSPSLLYDYQSIDALSRHLAEECGLERAS